MSTEKSHTFISGSSATAKKVNVTMKFLISHLPFVRQEDFVGRMQAWGFGVAEEGKYDSLVPVRLQESLGAVATFGFKVPEGYSGTYHSVGLAVHRALTVAKEYGALLLCSVYQEPEEEVDLPSEEAA